LAVPSIPHEPGGHRGTLGEAGRSRHA
jgi:hypothetical protein